MTRGNLKRKTYDDRALALALANQTKSTAEIAREFGLDERHIRHIRRGERRPELQPMIRAICRKADEQLMARVCEEVWALLGAQIRTALTGSPGLARRCREYLLDRFLPQEAVDNLWNDGPRAPEGASRTGQAPPDARQRSGAGRRVSGRRLKFYDDQSLVHDVGEGRLSLGQIARKHNVSRQLVARIRQGKYRPDLTSRIDALRELLVIESSRRVTPWLKALMAKELRVGITQEHDTARVCRQYILERFLPADSEGRCGPLGKRWRRRRRRRRSRHSSGSPPQRV